MSKSQAYLVKILSPILTREKKGVSIFAPQGSLLKREDRLIMPEFADFLDALATEGSDLVYHGEVTRIILDWARDGGLLTQQDLESY